MTRRMISDDVICTDKFLEMHKQAQVLYFFLLINGDDDGFVKSPKAVMAITKSKPKDLEELSDNGFVIIFDTGVLVIVHWRMMNKFDHADRKKDTECQDEIKQLHQNEAKMWVRNQSYTHSNGNRNGGWQ